jgi:hypothetical protein
MIGRMHMDGYHLCSDLVHIHLRAQLVTHATELRTIHGATRWTSTSRIVDWGVLITCCAGQ